MSRLRESGQLEQDADVIMLMSMADPQSSVSDRWLKVAKQKDGELGSICLAFDPKHMSFTPTDSRRWQKPALPAKKLEPLPEQMEVPFG